MTGARGVTTPLAVLAGATKPAARPGHRRGVDRLRHGGRIDERAGLELRTARWPPRLPHDRRCRIARRRRDLAAERLVEWVGAHAEARRDGDGRERQANAGRRRGLAGRQPERIGRRLERPEAMDRERTLGLGAQLRPQHAARADGIALGGIGAFVADIEAVAVAQVALEVDRRGEGVEGLDHRRRRHARRLGRAGQRPLHDAARRQGAVERQVAPELRLVLVVPQQAGFLRRRRQKRRSDTSEQRGQGRQARYPVHPASLTTVVNG
jgi:hypothetical protein